MEAPRHLHVVHKVKTICALRCHLHFSLSFFHKGREEFSKGHMCDIITLMANGMCACTVSTMINTNNIFEAKTSQNQNLFDL